MSIIQTTVNRKACPLENNCRQDSLIYQATVTQKDNQVDTYIGLAENTFKTRFHQHNSTSRLPHKRNSTSLSKKIWKLKDTNTEFTITWDIIAKSCLIRQRHAASFWKNGTKYSQEDLPSR
ncbi:hypothetical protein PoB_004221900 [Plakobranchus ocellatus]|uniref:GIY-YIG domain-containing protein n=1 Tax=Plakobranchus ocellatus TaxID=259542 RepID=A0AAV4BAH3_9GAST|nr:hypothetical protein PoB_004221900 [Plakobranchus ocellatus]